MKKILFGITSLKIGGAERVLIDMVNNLCEKFDITIFTLYGNGELECQINKRVKVCHLIDKQFNELSKMQQKMNSLRLLFQKKRIYNTFIKDKCEVEIAFLEGPITRLFSVCNNGVKKIAWVHNDISKVYGNGILAKIKKKFDEKAYKKFHKIIFVSKDNLKSFENFYNIDVDKKVIYNYLNEKDVVEKSKEKINFSFDNEKVNFVLVGRLVEQKGIDRLICLHKKLIDDGLEHNIYVLGEGSERKKLENLIKINGVDNSFVLLGQVKNPYPYITLADCFILPSYYEGYGMVLQEAKILDKVIIITDTAAKEAIEGYNKSFVLGNNEEAIYEGLKDILSSNKIEKLKDVQSNYNGDNLSLDEIENLLK